jgi:DNA-binding NarL/FixJ family response regulator
MNVLMIDDHPLILAAMQNVVRGLGDGVHLTGVETADEARELLSQAHSFDLVLLDLFLGTVDGYGVLLELRRTWPALPVVVVSASESAIDVIRCIDGGAMGFVPKRASNEMLFEALMLVMDGGIYVPPMARELGGPALPSVPDGEVFPDLPAQGALTLAAQAVARAAATGEPHTDTEPGALDGLSTGMPLGLLQPRDASSAGRGTFESLGLTPRQAEVLQQLLEGKANKVIARELGLSVETVKDHVAAVLRCLGVGSRMQAVVAVRHLQQRSGADARA